MKPFERAEVERLVHTYSDLILRLSYTYLKSTQDAEDICQNVFLKLLTSGKSFESPAHEKAWIIRMTANACKDVLRSAARRRTVGLELVADAAAPEAPHDEVLEAVMALPEKYREAIYLYYYEGYAVREIAEMLGRSEATINAHLSRGRGKLRDALGGEYHEQRV